MLPTRVRGIPEEFIELIKSYFLENKKILIILNRKSPSRFLFCGKCKKIQGCPSCGGIIRLEKDSETRCFRCSFESKNLKKCSVCSEELAVLEDISISSAKEAIKERVSEKGIFTLSSDELKDVSLILKDIIKSRIVVSTPVILNPFFKDIFDSIVYVRPESIFNMSEYDAAEMIFSIISELRELVKKGIGRSEPVIDVFSAFHFHYSLKLINDEEGFFERELKYRRWFLLPPFSNVYNIEVRDYELRKLGAVMRNMYIEFKDKLNINRVYLVSGKRIRGRYRGVLEAHSSPESILESGLMKKKNINIKMVSI